jgi:Flp pilus assembly protein TadD
MIIRPVFPFTVFSAQGAFAAHDLNSLPAGSEIYFDAHGPTHVVLPVQENPLWVPAGLRDLQKEVSRVFSEAVPFVAAAAGKNREPTLSTAGPSAPSRTPGNAFRKSEEKRVSYEERMREFRRVIERERSRSDEPSADSLLNLAAAQRAFADFEGSAATFLRLLARGDLDTRHRARFLSGLSVTLREMGLFELALERLGEALALKFTNPHYHCEKGVTLRAMGSRREAEKEITWAIGLDPTLPRFYCELAIVYAEEARARASQRSLRESKRYYRMALYALDGAFAAGSNHPRHFCEQGIILRELGNIPQALTYLRKAVSLDPTHPRHYEEIAATLDAMGRADEAAQARVQAARIKTGIGFPGSRI